jgi:hypothetical protein
MSVATEEAIAGRPISVIGSGTLGGASPQWRARGEERFAYLTRISAHSTQD